MSDNVIPMKASDDHTEEEWERHYQGVVAGTEDLWPEEEAYFHDCAMEEVSSTLVFLAHEQLRREGEPSDRGHIVEILLRAAREANWLSEEEVREMDKDHDASWNKK